PCAKRHQSGEDRQSSHHISDSKLNEKLSAGSPLILGKSFWESCHNGILCITQVMDYVGSGTRSSVTLCSGGVNGARNTKLVWVMAERLWLNYLGHLGAGTVSRDDRHVLAGASAPPVWGLMQIDD